jgi:hypothetical protein
MAPDYQAIFNDPQVLTITRVGGAVDQLLSGRAHKCLLDDVHRRALLPPGHQQSGKRAVDFRVRLLADP